MSPCDYPLGANLFLVYAGAAIGFAIGVVFMSSFSIGKSAGEDQEEDGP